MNFSFQINHYKIISRDTIVISNHFYVYFRGERVDFFWNTLLELITLWNEWFDKQWTRSFILICLPTQMHIFELVSYITRLYLHILRLWKSEMLEWRSQHFKNCNSDHVTDNMQKKIHSQYMSFCTLSWPWKNSTSRQFWYPTFKHLYNIKKRLYIFFI